MATYTLISSNVLSSSAATVSFTSIPATYTDLVVRFSARTDRAAAQRDILISFNGTTANYSTTIVFGNGSGTGSTRNSSAYYMWFGTVSGETVTANTFASGESYIPNYLASTSKPLSSFVVNEDNAASISYVGAWAGLNGNTAAVSSLTIQPDGNNFVSGSSFYLYGISNA